MSKIIFFLLCLLLGLAVQARTFEDIRQDATDVLMQLEKGEMNEAEARELLEDLEQEVLLMHQRKNIQASEITNQQQYQGNNSIASSENRTTQQRTNEIRETPAYTETKSTLHPSPITQESEKSAPSGIGFLRRFISFSWLWEVIVFLGYSALVIGGIMIAAVVYETFRRTTRSIAHSTQNRNPTISFPPIYTSGIPSSRPTVPQRPQQPAAITIPHSGEVPNHLC